MQEVFAYVSLAPCGCARQAATPRGLSSMLMESKQFRQQMEEGKIKAVLTREEWEAMPWRCDVCQPKGLFQE